jgi:hypothetical protein
MISTIEVVVSITLPTDSLCILNHHRHQHMLMPIHLLLCWIPDMHKERYSRIAVDLRPRRNDMEASKDTIVTTAMAIPGSREDTTTIKTSVVVGQIKLIMEVSKARSSLADNTNRVGIKMEDVVPVMATTMIRIAAETIAGAMEAMVVGRDMITEHMVVGRDLSSDGT